MTSFENQFTCPCTLAGTCMAPSRSRATRPCCSSTGSARISRAKKVEAVRAARSRRGWGFAAFDFRGHGESSGTLLDLRGSGLQADLESVRLYLAERGVQQLFLVGSSMGGWASSWFAQSHPESVLAMVLIAPAFRFLQRRWEEADESTRQTWQQTGRIRVRTEWLDVEPDRVPVAESAANFDP